MIYAMIWPSPPDLRDQRHRYKDWKKEPSKRPQNTWVHQTESNMLSVPVSYCTADPEIQVCPYFLSPPEEAFAVLNPAYVGTCARYFGALQYDGG